MHKTRLIANSRKAERSHLTKTKTQAEDEKRYYATELYYQIKKVKLYCGLSHYRHAYAVS